nr:hypothetical protein BaRGS_010325 [Batillaria attramentaria]
MKVIDEVQTTPLKEDDSSKEDNSSQEDDSSKRADNLGTGRGFESWEPEFELAFPLVASSLSVNTLVVIVVIIIVVIVVIIIIIIIKSL